MTVYIVEYFNPERPEEGADTIAVYDNREAAEAHANAPWYDRTRLQVAAYEVKSKFAT